MIILNHTTKYLFIEWDDGWNTDFFTLPVIGFASTNLNFKSVFVRFVRVVRIPSPRFINFHLSSGGMIADNHFKEDKICYFIFFIYSSPSSIHKKHIAPVPVLLPDSFSTHYSDFHPPNRLFCYRSEERRVGKECRSRWSPDQ